MDTINMPITLDDTQRERIARARRMNPSDRMRAGGELFEAMVARMAAGVRMQHPTADETTVQELVRQRLAIARRLENLE